MMVFSKARLLDLPQFLVWLFQGREKNALDTGVLDYPTLRVFSAQNGSMVGFLPVHEGIVLESLALNPDASPNDKLEAVIGMVDNVCREASAAGIRELFYVSSDERTDESAVRQLGFEEVKCFRKRIP